MGIEKLREENRMLKEQLEELKSQDSGGDKKQQPIQGMLKLLKTKNEQIQETIDKLEDSNLELKKSYEQTVQYYKRTVTALASVTMALVTMSSTVAPRDRSVTGYAKPCRNGPSARAPARCWVSL